MSRGSASAAAGRRGARCRAPNLSRRGGARSGAALVLPFALTCATAATAAAAAAAATAAAVAPPRPHLVYVLSDNLGWANVGYHHDSPEVVTPNINALVKSGVELDRLYTYKFCSPSRSSLLTGRLPIHVNLHNLPLQVPGAGIPLGMTTIAEKLKQAGYATHAVGKWHCGMATAAQTPTGRGFDSYFGYFTGYNDYLHSWSEYMCPNDPSLERSITYQTGLTLVSAQMLPWSSATWVPSPSVAQ